MNGLWLIGPEVRKYYKVTEIIRYQEDLVLKCKSAFKRFSTASQHRSLTEWTPEKFIQEAEQIHEDVAKYISQVLERKAYPAQAS